MTDSKKRKTNKVFLNCIRYLKILKSLWGFHPKSFRLLSLFLPTSLFCLIYYYLLFWFCFHFLFHIISLILLNFLILFNHSILNLSSLDSPLKCFLEFHILSLMGYMVVRLIFRVYSNSLKWFLWSKMLAFIFDDVSFIFSLLWRHIEYSR